MADWLRQHPTASLCALWALLSTALLAASLPHVGTLGMYYDEAFLAQQARGFVEPARAGVHPPGTSTLWIAGRPLPTRNAGYLGSLKSQLQIPSLALVGSRASVVRLTTLFWGALGLLFSMLLAQRLLGPAVAAWTGVLVASDPSFFFFAQYEWGPFTTGLLCRTAGLWLVVEGWQRERSWIAALGGVVLGLGAYNRADFAVILAAAALGLALLYPDVARRAATTRRSLALWMIAGLTLGASPIVPVLEQIFATSSLLAAQGDLTEKARVLWSVLDGSHFYRVQAAGGRFEELFDMGAPHGLFALVSLTAIVFAAARWRAFELAELHAGRFVLIVTLVVGSLMLALPGAVRAHHQLNVMPFVHMLVALTAVDLWRWAQGRRSAQLLRAGLLLAALVVGVAQLNVVHRTHELIESTGGRGWWSGRIERAADALDAEPGAIAVSLDWGFHEPLLFLTSRAELTEPIWQIGHARQLGRAWTHDGDDRHVYLVHPERFDLFGYGPAFLAAVERDAGGAARIEEHRDREGEVAFLTVRFDRAHRFVYGGEFRIFLR